MHGTRVGYMFKTFVFLLRRMAKVMEYVCLCAFALWSFEKMLAQANGTQAIAIVSIGIQNSLGILTHHSSHVLVTLIT